MAEQTSTASSSATKKKEIRLKLQMREILGNAYAFVRGRQYTETISNITYEELLDKAIDRIEGTTGSVGARATILERVEKIKNEISNAVSTVKKKSPDYWKLDEDEEDSTNAMNTEE